MLCYQADDGTVRILNGWAEGERWQRGSTLQRAAAGSPLAIINFEHHGNRGVRLFFEDENSMFREACWDQIGDKVRADSGYFLGGYMIPASGRASISAIEWMEEELEMRIYSETGARTFERRYSGAWVWYKKSLEEAAKEAHISALRWDPGRSSVYSVEHEGLVEIMRADGSWIRTGISSKSVCLGPACPSRRQPLRSCVPSPPPQQLLAEFPASLHGQVQALGSESQEAEPMDSRPTEHRLQEDEPKRRSLAQRISSFLDCCH